MFFCFLLVNEIYVLYVWWVGGRDGLEHGITPKTLRNQPQKDKWQQREHQEMISARCNSIICHYERYESAAFLVLISECVVWT